MRKIPRVRAEGLSPEALRAAVSELREQGYHVRVDGTVEQRLIAHSAPAENGCVLWLAYRNAGGYGRTSANGRLMLAHRAAYELRHGPIPAGLDACHRCDTPACINPDHLFLGTDRENVRDREKKGRGHDRRGRHNGQSKLTEGQVRLIRSAGRSCREVDLAERFGVGPTTIGKIRRGESWGHVV